MSSPQRFINRMIVFLVGAAAAAGTAYEVLFRIYMYNPLLNGLILGILLIGIVYMFRRVFILRPEIRWSIRRLLWGSASGAWARKALS